MQKHLSRTGPGPYTAPLGPRGQVAGEREIAQARVRVGGQGDFKTRSRDLKHRMRTKQVALMVSGHSHSQDPADNGALQGRGRCGQCGGQCVHWSRTWTHSLKWVLKSGVCITKNKATVRAATFPWSLGNWRPRGPEARRPRGPEASALPADSPPAPLLQLLQVVPRNRPIKGAAQSLVHPPVRGGHLPAKSLPVRRATGHSPSATYTASKTRQRPLRSLPASSHRPQEVASPGSPGRVSPEASAGSLGLSKVPRRPGSAPEPEAPPQTLLRCCPLVCGVPLAASWLLWDPSKTWFWDLWRQIRL